MKRTLIAATAAAAGVLALATFSVDQPVRGAVTSTVRVEAAAYGTGGSTVKLTPSQTAAGVAEGITFATSTSAVTIYGDAEHNALQVDVVGAGTKATFKSRSGYNYSCTATQGTCYPNRPYAWSYLVLTNGTTSVVRLNPGIGAGVPKVVKHEGKDSFVATAEDTTARMVLTNDGLVTYIIALEHPDDAVWKFFLKDNTTTSWPANKTGGLLTPLNWYKAEAINNGTGKVVGTVWRADVEGGKLQGTS